MRNLEAYRFQLIDYDESSVFLLRRKEPNESLALKIYERATPAQVAEYVRCTNTAYEVFHNSSHFGKYWQIVPVLEYRLIDGKPATISPYVKGKDLGQKIATGWHTDTVFAYLDPMTRLLNERLATHAIELGPNNVKVIKVAASLFDQYWAITDLCTEVGRLIV